MHLSTRFFSHFRSRKETKGRLEFELQWLIFCPKVCGTKVVHAVKLILRLNPRVWDCRRGLMMNVRGRLLPNNIVMSEIVVSSNILSISVPSDTLQHVRMSGAFEADELD